MLQSAILILSGFATVIVVLALLWAVCSGVGWGFRLAVKRSQTRKLNLVNEEERSTITDGELTLTQDLPAIVAAVTAAIDKPFRIVDVVAPAHRTVGWNQGTSFVHMTGQRMPWDRITFTNEGKRRGIKFW